MPTATPLPAEAGTGGSCQRQVFAGRGQRVATPATVAAIYDTPGATSGGRLASGVGGCGVGGDGGGGEHVGGPEERGATLTHAAGEGGGGGGGGGGVVPAREGKRTATQTAAEGGAGTRMGMARANGVPGVLGGGAEPCSPLSHVSVGAGDVKVSLVWEQRRCVGVVLE